MEKVRKDYELGYCFFASGWNSCLHYVSQPAHFSVCRDVSLVEVVLMKQRLKYSQGHNAVPPVILEPKIH